MYFVILAITYIAFIECVLTPRHLWKTIYGFPQLEDPRTDGLYKANEDDAEIRLADIKENRRYFRFVRNGEVRIVNNVIVYDDEWSEEIAVDDSKKFPKKKRIDE